MAKVSYLIFASRPACLTVDVAVAGMCRLKKIVGSNNFSAQFINMISHYKKIGYNINVLQQTACLVVNPITAGNFALLFNCTPATRTSDSLKDLSIDEMVGASCFSCFQAHPLRSSRTSKKPPWPTQWYKNRLGTYEKIRL